MTDDTRIPDMRHAHVMDVAQYRRSELVPLTHPILGSRAVDLACHVAVAEQAGNSLLDYHFLVHGLLNALHIDILTDTANHSLQCLARSALCEVIGTIGNHVLHA